MATFTGLQTDVNNLARRTVDTVVYTLLTAELNDRLRISEMEVTTTITANAESEALPAGFLEARAAYLDATPRVPLEIVSEFTRANQFRTSGRPRRVAFSKGVALFNPVPDGTYSVSLRYVSKLADLSGGSDTNDVMDNHYRLYVYGALKHWAQSVLVDDARTAAWGSLFEAAMMDAMKADDRKRYGAGPLVSQPAAVG